jgi:homoserine dehydrogenase
MPRLFDHEQLGGLGPRTLKLCLLGFGTVARGFLDVLRSKEEQLERDFGLRVLISAAGTRHGSLIEPDGLRAGELQARVADAGLPAPARSPHDLLAAAQADILIEATVMEHEAGAPQATAHIETAFSLGMDVITVNKGPVAWNFTRLNDLALAKGRRWRFEGTVADGMPVFNLLETALPGCKLLGFDAVFNSTTNFILESMAAGRSFDDAVGQAQADGFAEADPSHDIDGWDAASKAAALANVAMDAQITPADIPKATARQVTLEQILGARERGARLRIVSSCRLRDEADAARLPVLSRSRSGGKRASWGRLGPVAGRDEATAPDAPEPPVGVDVRVGVVELPLDHPLAHIGSTSLGVLLHTDLMGDVFIEEIDALVPQTAYSVYSDMLTLHLQR